MANWRVTEKGSSNLQPAASSVPACACPASAPRAAAADLPFACTRRSRPKDGDGTNSGGNDRTGLADFVTFGFVLLVVLLAIWAKAELGQPSHYLG
jgi:hypothetical protein